MAVRKFSNMSKITKIFLVLVTLVLISLGGGYIYIKNEVSKYNNLIYPSVYIENINLSSKSKTEAKNIMNKKFSNPIEKKNINIIDDGESYSLLYSKLKPKYDIDKAIDEAFDYGKNLKILDKYNIINKKETKKYKLSLSYDKKYLREFLNYVEKKINRNYENAKINVSNGNINITDDKKGKKLDKDKLNKMLESKIKSKSFSDINIKAPVNESEAKITKNKLSVINKNVSNYTTNYGSISSSERMNNIKIATDSINGTLLMPNDIFSFNKIVGPRTLKKGYKKAPVIVGTKAQPGLGGGICQVSSTLYNCILEANLKPVEREHHSIPSHYVELGRDATVNYGSIDLKFKNTLKYPIYIEGKTSNGNVNFNIYSNKSLNNISYKISSKVYDTITPKEKYIYDSSIPKGKIEITNNSSMGYKVKTYRNIIKNGKIIKKELVSDDFYRPVDKLIKKGV
ncbi:VanW family protein [Clostridium oceanicum]|uniref:VanW family protein n=1 Tax=Clostridium oceanicum TaxID=1543 RepID=A0ABN1JQC3_9CLOT